MTWASYQGPNFSCQSVGVARLLAGAFWFRGRGDNPLEDFKRHLFPFLSHLARRPDARGAARGAWAFCNEPPRFFKQRIAHAEERFAETHAAGIFIIKVDIR